jgi:hypothetical protein
MTFPGADDELEPKGPLTETPDASSPEQPPAGPALQFEGLIDISDPIANWQKFLWMVSKASVAKAILLNEGNPISFKDDVLKVEFQPEKALIGNALNDPLLKDDLERILSDLYERPVILETQLKRQGDKGSQAGLFEGEVDPDVSELKDIIENKVLKKVSSARIQRIEKTE